MEKLLLLIIGLWSVVIVLGFVGCSGLELGGKLGVYAVDERQESQRTYRRPALKCLFVSCPEAGTRDVEGS